MIHLLVVTRKPYAVVGIYQALHEAICCRLVRVSNRKIDLVVERGKRLQDSRQAGTIGIWTNQWYLMTQIRSQLRELLDTTRVTSCQYVRCLYPKTPAAPSKFIVGGQPSAEGVLWVVSVNNYRVLTANGMETQEAASDYACFLEIRLIWLLSFLFRTTAIPFVKAQLAVWRAEVIAISQTTVIRFMIHLIRTSENRFCSY